MVAGCARESIIDKVEKEYENGRYREAIFLVRHHFKGGGEKTPELLFLAGKSWLQLGAEAEAEDAFSEVYRSDSTWAPVLAGFLRDRAVIGIESGSRGKGERLMMQAIAYDTLLDFGKYNATAGRLLIERREFRAAIPFLDRYLLEYPDTTGAASVMLNLGAAYEGAGRTEEAISVYRRFVDMYPKSRLLTTVSWQLENLLLMKSEELYENGKVEEAEQYLIDLTRTAGSSIVRERANFLLGEMFEERGDIEKAIFYYTETIQINLGSSGRLVEKAKERIEKIDLSKKNR